MVSFLVVAETKKCKKFWVVMKWTITTRVTKFYIVYLFTPFQFEYEFNIQTIVKSTRTYLNNCISY